MADAETQAPGLSPYVKTDQFEAGINKLGAKLDELGKKSKDTEKSFTGMFDQLKKFTVQAAAVAGLTLSLDKLLSVALENEKINKQLDLQLQRFKATTDLSKQSIEAFAQKLQGITSLDSDDIKRAEVNILQMGFASTKTNESITLLAAAMAKINPNFTSVSDAAGFLTRALQNPAGALRALRQAGIAIDPVMARQIDQLVQHGDAAKASSILFDQLVKSTGDLNKALSSGADLIGTHYNQLKNTVSDSVKAIATSNEFTAAASGAFDLLKLSIQNLGKPFQEFIRNLESSPELVHALADSFVFLEKVIISIGGGLRLFVEYLRYAGELASTLLAGKFDNIDIVAEKFKTNTAEILMETGRDLDNVGKKADGATAGFGHLSLSAKDLAGNVNNLNNATETAIEKITRQSRQYRELIDALRQGGDAYEIMKRQVDAESAAREAGLRIGSREGQQFIEKFKQMEALKNQFDILKKADDDYRDAIKKPFVDAATNVKDTFATAFNDIISKGKTSFSSFAQSIKNTFFKLASDIASALIFQPIINNINAAFSYGGTAANVGSVGGGTAANRAGGGVGISDILGIGNLFGGGSGGASSLFGATGSITSALNGFGSSYLGFASGAPFSATAAGPGLTSSVFGGSTLSSFLGDAGFGTIGSLGASLLGLSKGGIGSTIGSTAGSLIGAIGGPIGAIAGGFLGSILGGLFGNSQPSNFTSGAIIGGNGYLQNFDDKANDNTKGQRDQLVGVIQKLFQAVVAVGGVQQKNIGFDIGQRDPTRLYINPSLTSHGNSIDPNTAIATTSPGNATGLVNLIIKNLNQVFGGLSQTMQQVISRGGDVDTVIANLNFAQLYDSLKAIQQPLDDVQQAFKDLGTQFDAYILKSNELGLDAGSLAHSIGINFDQSIANSIRKITDPSGIALDALDKDNQARIDYARKIGANVAQVEQYNALLRVQVLQQYGLDAVGVETQTAAQRLAILKQSSEQILEFLNSQLLGDTSNLTPGQKLSEAQSQFNSALTEARTTGDASNLTSAAGNLLSIGKNYYGGATADYANLQNMTRSTLTNFGHDLGLPGFATGGSMRVGGWGGKDSQLVSFRATPNEHVEVNPPGESSTRAIAQQTVELKKYLKAIIAKLDDGNRQDSLNNLHKTISERKKVS